VILNDIQFPFHDAKVLDKLVVPFVVSLRPDGVILNGDIVDCYSISDFDKDPLTQAGLGLERKLAQSLMLRLTSIPERIWIGGNHEDRLRRLVWKKPDLLRVLPAEVKVDLVTRLDFPQVFGLAEHGFRWIPYGGTVHLGKLLVTHGSLVSKHSGQSARAHLDKYGMSVLIGHTHRGGVTYKTDVAGVHGAYENFCLCSLKPEYVQHPNWQQGFSVVTVDERTGFFNVQPIPILNRRCFFYGRDKVSL
jgi:predicted phosphodiesterase